MKNARSTRASCEIIGEITLFAIAVASVSIIFTQVSSIPAPADTTDVTIIGKIENGYPVFDLQRGESLGLDTHFILTVAGWEKSIFLQNDLANHEWEIGDRIVLPVEVPNGIEAEAIIVDVKTNSIVFSGVLQEGFTTRFKGGLWHFDEPIWNRIPDEVIDSSGNNNHGVAIGDANIINGILQPQNVKCNNSGYFDGYLDAVKVKTSWTLNITKMITIEAWMKPQVPEFISDIVGVSGTFGYTPYIIHVTGDIFAIVSEDYQKGGLLSTVAIDDEGIVSYCKNLTLGKSTGSNVCQPKITQMTEKTYLVSYIDNKYLVTLKAVNISNTGDIEYKNQLVFTEKSSTNQPNRLGLQKITDNICAIAYWTPTNGGLIKTVSVSPAGMITNTGNMIQFDPASSGDKSRSPFFIHVFGDVFALAYCGPSNHGVLKTFNITSTGNITYTGKMVEFDALSGYEPCLIQVSNNVFALAYRNNMSYGIVKTFKIFNNGSVTPTGNTMAFENILKCYDPYIIYAEEDMYIIVYSSGSTSQSSAKGYFITLRLEPNGVINPLGSRTQFEVPDGETCHYPIIINVENELYAISYTGPIAHTGYLITILIGPHGRGIYKGDSYQIYANMTMVEGYIDGFRVSYYNNSIGLHWHHFALTYNGMTIRLYMNGTVVNETSYPYHRINLTRSPLYFGRFYCGFIDEIAIYDKVLTQEQIRNHFMYPGIPELVPF
jgi:hypothetical protein